MEVAEGLDANGIVHTAHADLLVAVGLDQLSHELAGGVVVGGVELHRSTMTISILGLL